MLLTGVHHWREPHESYLLIEHTGVVINFFDDHVLLLYLLLCLSIICIKTNFKNNPNIYW